MKYIAYYRVSTKKQGISGLGLEAQKTAVAQFLKDGNCLVTDEFTDIESGKNNQRPELIKAIKKAKETKATLLIAKLDRLSRNAAFIFTLRDSKIDFVCADMPNANAVTIGIMAVLAQDERERISHRTKAALSELKKQGKQLGSPTNLSIDAIRKGMEIRRANAIEDDSNKKSTALIVSLRSQGKSFYQITKELNQAGFRTRRGKEFTQTQTQRLFSRNCE
ncbi:recombinase family protein [Polluticoccus soli]|uniref:recombinase family protein n=1 Tax=Polluticoccus soli TaxID=3034150 RepID=UPI0023E0D234|nr:recombinase family protein [Flavipsychrobacter sp. JY13-12]